MKKYMASTGTPRITIVEVKKETESSIWLPHGQRRAKLADYESYFDTWEEAQKHLIDYFSRKLGDVQRSMNFAIKVLEEAKDLKKPE